MSQKELINENSKEIKASKYIICPECQENTRINIINYKINIHGCKNNHNINQLSINDYKITQNINTKKIKCQICKGINQNNKSNYIFKCLNCKQNICESCKSIHDKTHNFIYYNEKLFVCNYHYKEYNAYCIFCKEDICSVCEKEHQGHKIISYEGMLPDMVKLQSETIELNNRKEELKIFIKDIMDKLNYFIEEIDDWFGIYEDIINCYSNKSGNYFLFQNINEMKKFNKAFVQDINKILNEKNNLTKINNLTDLYYNMNLSSDKIEIPENKIEECKEEEKSNIFIKNKNSDDSIINKTVDVNVELMMISEDNKDNDYLTLDITKMKKIITLKNEKLIFKKIYILKDGRIIIHNNNKELFLCFIFDLVNDQCFNLNIKYMKDFIQIDDNTICILINSEILLINIEEKNFEIIQSIKKEVSKMIKLTNQKILVFEGGAKTSTSIFIYENKKLILENEISLNPLKNNIYDSVDIQVVNEKELLILYFHAGFFDFKYYLSFINIETGKKIKSFGLSFRHAISLFNENILIVGSEKKIYPIDLINHTKKKEFKLEKMSNIHSILTLNEKQIIVAQYDYINQFELDSSYNFKLLHFIELQSNKIYKFPKSRFIIEAREYEPKQLFLYG